MISTHRIAPLLLATAVLVILAGLSACGGADARRASHIARGQKYLAAGRLDKARVEFSNALQIEPNDDEARYLNGRVAEGLGDFRAAAAMYRGAIDVNPNHVQARARLALLYTSAGLPEKAMDLVKPALVTHPDDPGLLVARGAARLRLRDGTGARADAERAVQLAPGNPDAVLLLGELYRLSGETSRSIELLNAALAKMPQSLELHEALARLYQSSGDSAQAEEQLRQLVQIKPAELPLRLQLTSFYVGAKRLDEAERTLKDAVSAFPQSTGAKLVYADFLSTFRSRQQGESALRGLIAHDPRDFELRLGLGALQQRAGATQDAVATYRAIIQEDPDGASGVAARDRIAAIEATAGRYGEALPLLAAALQHNPHDSDALILRGNIELRQANAAAAIADLRAVLRDQPHSVPLLRTLARAHLADSQPTLAEDSLRTALASAPHDLDVRIDLAALLVQTRRAEQAVAMLQDTIKETPDASGAAARSALVEACMAVPDLPAARVAAEELKALRPDLARGAYLAGMVAQRQGRLNDAQREFEQALRLQPSATDALAALAQLELSRGQHAQAISLVRGAVEHAPDNALLQNLLGELCLADRSYPQSVAALSEAMRLAPHWWVPYRNLARARSAASDPAGTLAAYEAGVKATAEPVLVVDLAELYVSEGRSDDAIRQYELLHERSPHLELAANNLAMLLVTYRSDQASLDRARDLTVGFATSDVGALLDTRGWVLFKRGDVPEALSLLQRAAVESPNSRVILYHLGMAQLKAGQSDKARASLEAALAGGESFTGTNEARLALAQLRARTG